MPYARLFALLLAAGCHGGAADSDTADTAPGPDTDSDTDDTGVDPAVQQFIGSPSDAAGNAVALPGDMDADGADDVVVAAYYGNRVCMFAGSTLRGGDTRHLLDDADTCWTGNGAYEFSGYAVSGAGDGDGDGRADLLIGAIGDATNGTNAGRVYLLSGATPGTASLGDAAVASLVGEYGSDYAGVGLIGGADLTGDGAADYLVGASGSDAGGAGGGKAYLVPGPLVGETQLSAVATTFLGLPLTSAGPVYHGEFGGGDAVGNAVAFPGDLNGDGVPDLALGASGADEFGAATGKVVLYYGPIAEGAHLITDADAALIGPAAFSYAGSPIHAPGQDLDGDGLADLFVSADGIDNGSVFLVHGAADRTGEQSLNDQLTRWTGEVADDQAGFALATGDLNGDGTPDLAVGAPGNDRSGADGGATYVVFGPFGPGSHALADADRVLTGQAVADAFGRSLASASDIDGDGVDDLLVGAVYNDEGGAFSGQAYLYGSAAR